VTAFDDYIRCKGIEAKRVYDTFEIAKILNVHYRTVQRYMFDGRRTGRYGIIGLKYYMPLNKCEILGADLIEFLRKSNGEN